MDGDWAWYDIPMTDDGIEFHDKPVAQTNEMWYINAFSFHAQLGFSIIDQVVEVYISCLESTICIGFKFARLVMKRTKY